MYSSVSLHIKRICVLWLPCQVMAGYQISAHNTLHTPSLQKCSHAVCKVLCNLQEHKPALTLNICTLRQVILHILKTEWKTGGCLTARCKVTLWILKWEKKKTFSSGRTASLPNTQTLKSQYLRIFIFDILSKTFMYCVAVIASDFSMLNI